MEEFSLTPRQVQIVSMLAQGMSDWEIAESLYLSWQTVRGHIKNSLKAMHAHDRAELIEKARRYGQIAC